MKAFGMFAVRVAGAVFVVNLVLGLVGGTVENFFWNPASYFRRD